jgi:orotate phosphoribosyltransferase
MDDLGAQVASALIEIGAVGFTPVQPVKFKSGIFSPIYVDNRRLPYYPESWRLVITGFEYLINDRGLSPDVIAGVETAGIPHSAALAYHMGKPSVFVRKQPKDHGAMKLVEGGDVSGKRVILIEDHITTGGSSLTGIEGLRREGGIVEHCLAITSYGFPESIVEFNASRVQLHILCGLSTILEVARKKARFGQEELNMIEDWSRNPQEWSARQGGSR